jgi:predicted ATPase
VARAVASDPGRVRGHAGCFRHSAQRGGSRAGRVYQRAGYQLGITAQFVLLSSALLFCSEPEAALEAIDHGLTIVNDNDEHFLAAELYRLKARTLLVRGAADAKAEALLDRALQTARSQQARSLELRAATEIAGFWMNKGRRAEALDLLGPICGSFTEGFDTKDLKNTKAMLSELGCKPIVEES